MCYATHFFLRTRKGGSMPHWTTQILVVHRTPTLRSEYLYTYHGRPSFWLRLYKRITTCDYSNYPIDLGHTAHVLSQVFNLQNTSYTDGPTIPPVKTITLSECHPAGLFCNTSTRWTNGRLLTTHKLLSTYTIVYSLNAHINIKHNLPIQTALHNHPVPLQNYVQHPTHKREKLLFYC